MSSKEKREAELRYIEFLLFRAWFKNKDADGVFAFEPVNIRSEVNPCFISALKYDCSQRSEQSAAALAATASDDKLLIGGKNGQFVSACCYRIGELKTLVKGLDGRDGK